MEYIVVAIASLIAGVGTGLVGLSAATAMVPLLVVLCPTFGGEHGAYMATAIALASDILGSAVTTAVYAKNKNIDLKRGLIMLICIIGMCAIGSVAAFFTKQQVLGGFSLVLCVAIGIRFLVKPDSKEREPGEGNTGRLSAGQIALSLFFGLTIGFGTGYFGTGGGMMMLIVFTAMLGYDRKTAVGTSTFIMTFTALIASVSHIIMEPTLLLEEWRYLLLAIVVATVASLISARLANKVNGRVVGLITGALLLALGVTLVILHYIEYIPALLLSETLKTFGIWILCIAAAALVLIVLRFTVHIADYIFRKLLHMVAIFSILPLVLLTDMWLAAVASIGIFLVLIFIALRLIDTLPFYKRLFVEKRDHEVLFSFLALFAMFAVFLAVSWGLLRAPFIAVAAVMAWGPGDAMAAIVGKRLGKRKITGRLVEGTKTVEGTLAMAATSFIAVLLTLLFMTAIPWYIVLPASLLIGAACALVELFTLGGWDTVTVPTTAFALLLPLLLLV